MADNEKSNINVGGDIGGNIVMGNNSAINISNVNIAKGGRAALRHWWHDIVRTHGRYSCYAMFLTLPADNEAIKYLTEFGKELHVISGDNCLVIALSKNDFKMKGFSEDAWIALAEEHSKEGYSVKIAQLFDIPLTEFPCLLTFKDIRSSDHVSISLKKLSVAQIAEKMRGVFSVIQKCAAEKEDPLNAIEKNLQITARKGKQNIVAQKIGSFAEKTLEVAMQAMIESTLK